MNIKKNLVIAALTAIIPLSLLSVNVFADDAVTHTVTVKGYDGNNIAILTVAHGASANLSQYETSDKLNYHSNKYTQVGFSQWSENTDSVTEDMTVYALYVAMTIDCTGEPVKTEYYSKKGPINIDGLKVTITKYTQLPDKLENGEFTIDTNVTDITDSCVVLPAVIDQLFIDGDTATVNVIPPSANMPIKSFQISYFEGLGDVNHDEIIDSTDASEILEYYSIYSTGNEPQFSDNEFDICDIDRNGIIDPSDASLILDYYGLNTVDDDSVTWDDILK